MFSIEYAKAVHADRLREAAEKRRARAVRPHRSRPIRPPKVRWRLWPLTRRRRAHRPVAVDPCATC